LRLFTPMTYPWHSLLPCSLHPTITNSFDSVLSIYSYFLFLLLPLPTEPPSFLTWTICTRFPNDPPALFSAFSPIFLHAVVRVTLSRHKLAHGWLKLSIFSTLIRIKSKFL
jgi:hypothetical protein